MLTKLVLIFFCINLVIIGSFAQEHMQRLSEIDVLHYRFQLELNDENDIIQGKAKIDIQFLKPLSTFQLDLFAKSDTIEKGMSVSNILHGKNELAFDHAGEKLTIQLEKPSSKGEIYSFIISYEGIPSDGLVIGENKYGDRTFFGDNWPDRAHHWLPTVDHPSDKATVEFIVTAPDHYQVIANGEQIEETNITDDIKLTHWKANVPLPTKVMVFGAARFAVNLAGYVDDIPVTTWVYRQDRDDGFGDYRIAVEVLDFFYKKMGNYPYVKLANVQSKTRYGGMENAGNIFYFENSVNGKQDQEKLIAHEIAHQWFGNSASELNWHHVWLSEGFATYMTDLYLEEVQGREASIGNLKSERERVIKYAHRRPIPIIDTTITDYNKLLSPNSYQKGAWVLHMLRHEIGDELFWNGIRSYYQKYKFSNALSEDLQKIMEEVSGKTLDSFFKQWLYQAGHPVLKIKRKKSTITIRQVQDYPFEFPLELDIINEDGKSIRKTIKVNSAEHKLKVKIKGKIQQIIVDPDCWLLFEVG